MAGAKDSINASRLDGMGKPEPLKYLGADVWSRRITQEHRCVYLVKAGRVWFLQGRYGYWSPARQPVLRTPGPRAGLGS